MSLKCEPVSVEVESCTDLAQLLTFSRVIRRGAQAMYKRATKILSSVRVSSPAGVGGQGHGAYRGTSLIRKRTPLGPYSRVLWGSQVGGRFLMGEVPLYQGHWTYTLNPEHMVSRGQHGSCHSKAAVTNKATPSNLSMCGPHRPTAVGLCCWPLFVADRFYIVYRQSPLCLVDPSFRALSVRLKFSVQRQNFNIDSLLWPWFGHGSFGVTRPFSHHTHV